MSLPDGPRRRTAYPRGAAPTIRLGRAGLLAGLLALAAGRVPFGAKEAWGALPPPATPAPASDPGSAPPEAGAGAGVLPNQAPNQEHNEDPRLSTPEVDPASRMVPSLAHTLQLGMAVLVGTGYRGIFPYKEDIYCGSNPAGNNQAAVCTGRAPTFIDLEPSLGLSPGWDILLTVRFGIERDFNTRHQVLLMPGFRYWLDPERRVKFFTTLQLAYDRSAQNSTQVGDEDLGVRNSNGLMVEIMRNLGAYVQFGETVGFSRWLSFTVDVGAGAQARFP